MGTRKAMSKGLRFDIFRRDGFTCQYCGRQPPEVVLHVDHITPVVEGGTNDEMNLVASCRDCNLGKGRKLLDKPQRPDADLAWLEMQQEVAEMRAFQEIQQQMDALIETFIKQLQDTWSNLTGRDWVPHEVQLRKMLAIHDPADVLQALKITAVKESNYQLQGRSGWLKYMWGILWKKAKDNADDE